MALPGLNLLARAVLWLEPLYLALTVLAFWYPPPTRTDWLWLLWLLVPVGIARYVVHGRVLTRTPLDVWFVAFVALGALNVVAAPYTRGLEMLARPVLGMALCYAMIESARTAGSMRGPVQVMTMLALLVGLLAVGASQWNNKANLLDPVIAVMPTIRGFPGAEQGFNANEIAGALAWLLPLMAGLAVYRWQQRLPRWDVTLAFGLLLVALLLGQSRSAIVGVLAAFFLMIPLLARRWPGRLVMYAALLVIVGLQAYISLDFAQTEQQRVEAVNADASRARPAISYNTSTISSRLQIWSSAAAITRDYPLTGVGLSMFRDGRVRADYPIPLMEGRIVPHAHNELLQVAADMGLPGLLVYIGLHVATGVMLLRSWRRGDAAARAVTVAVAGGLVGHAVYGLTDAVTLWDRFAFVFWMLLGLAAAQYVLVTRPAKDSAL